MNILPQITQITQRNAASCIISQRKTGCVGSVVVEVLLFWVLSASSARSAGDIGVSLFVYSLSMLACL